MRKLTANNQTATVPVEEPKQDVYSIAWNKFNDIDDDDDDNNDLRDRIDGGYSINFNLKKNNVSFSTNGLYLTLTDISCGICQMSNITNLYNYNLRKAPNYKQLVKNFLENVVSELKEKGNFAFVLVSNNDSYPELNDVLSDLAIKQTDWEENPNSGNMIKIFIL